MMKAVWTRREIILLPAIMVGLVVIAQLNQMWRRIEMVLRGSIQLPRIRRSRPETEILTAQARQNAQNMVQPDLPDRIWLDLSIPNQPNSDAASEVGIQFLRTLLSRQLAPNIMVLSTNVQPLVHIKP